MAHSSTENSWAKSSDEISYDPHTGLPLDKELVRKGREEEIKFMELLKVWSYLKLQHLAFNIIPKQLQGLMMRNTFLINLQR